MDLNTRFIAKSLLDQSEGHVRVLDYKGDALLELEQGYISQGDMVAVIMENGERKLYSLKSPFALDTILKRRLVTGLNELFTESNSPSRLDDFGIWYRDEVDGKVYINNTPLQ